MDGKLWILLLQIIIYHPIPHFLIFDPKSPAQSFLLPGSNGKLCLIPIKCYCLQMRNCLPLQEASKEFCTTIDFWSYNESFESMIQFLGFFLFSKSGKKKNLLFVLITTIDRKKVELAEFNILNRHTYLEMHFVHHSTSYHD